MLATLVTLRPLLSGSDRRATINLCSVADRRVTALGGIPWEPCITQAPALGMQFWNGDFEQGTEAGKVDFTFNLEVARRSNPDVINAVWMGAIVEVAVGRVGTPAPWKTSFVGRVTAYAGGEYPAMKISASVDLEPFQIDVLGETYAGTGGAEGGTDLKDRLKPLAVGRPRNVEPVLINAIDSVYQFSAYGPIEAVETLFERASAFPAASADYPDYAALVAATILPGHWATCLAHGMIRLGAPAAGVITGDIRGHAVGGVAPRGAGAIVRMLADMRDVPTGLIARDRLAALDAEGATNSDVMITDQVSFLEAARRFILPCNWQVVVSNLGVLLPMKPVIEQDVSLVLHAQGRREPLCGAATEEAVSVPYKKTVMAASRAWRVHTLDEIASAATLIPRGDYDAATVYREGNIVTMPGGARWQYISTTPQAGITPGTNPAVWASMELPSTYSDGTPIDDLQPAEPDAQITRAISVSMPAVTFLVDGSGVPDPLQFPFNIQATVTEANYNATLQSDFSISADPTITASIDNTPSSPTRGRVTITAITGPGKIQVNALRAGVALSTNIAVATKGALADKSEVGTGDVQPFAISAGDTAAMASPTPGAGTSTWITAVSYTLTIPSDESDWGVVAIVTGSQGFPSGSGTWNIRLMADGVRLAGAGGEKAEDSFALSGRANWGAGTHTFSVEWAAGSNVNLAEASMVIFWMKR